jgi:hypothetical protein
MTSDSKPPDVSYAADATISATPAAGGPSAVAPTTGKAAAKPKKKSTKKQTRAVNPDGTPVPITNATPQPKKPRKPRPKKEGDGTPKRRPSKKKKDAAANAAPPSAGVADAVAGISASQDPTQLIGSALEDLFNSGDPDDDDAAGKMFLGGSQGMVPDWMMG